MSKDVIQSCYKFLSEHYSSIKLQNFFTIPDSVTFWRQIIRDRIWKFIFWH